MSDLVWRLRSMARNEHDDLSVGDEAADEIERLRNWRDTAVANCARRECSTRDRRLQELQAEVARLTAERDALAVELKRVQRLPELEWAEACSRIMQVLASAARAGFPVRDTVAVAAMDAGKTYVDRINAERDALRVKVALWHQVWDNVALDVPDLRDDNKPLAVAASYELLKQEVARLTAEQDAVSAAIGTNEYMDPPDGGNVSLAEQVRRMRDALLARVEAAEARVSTSTRRAKQ